MTVPSVMAVPSVTTVREAPRPAGHRAAAHAFRHTASHAAAAPAAMSTAAMSTTAAAASKAEAHRCLRGRAPNGNCLPVAHDRFPLRRRRLFGVDFLADIRV